MNDLIQKDGMLQTGTGTYVNPNFLSQQGLAQAQNYAGVSPTIPAANLGTIAPMSLKPQSPLTMADGLIGAIESAATTFATEQAQTLTQNNEVAQLKAKKDSSKNQLLDKMGVQQGETALTDQAYSQTVDPIEKDLKAINQQIFEEQNGLRKQLEGIQQIGTLTDAQKQAKGNELKRQSASYQADLYVKQLGIQGQYDSAKAIADRKIAMTLEKDRQDLETLRFNYEENKEEYTKKEQRQFDEMYSAKERALDAQAKKMQTFEDTRISLLKSANEQNAPSSIKIAIANAKTTDEAIQAAGQYAGDVLDRQYKQAQLEKLREESALTSAQRAKILAESTVNPDSKEAIQKSEALTLATELRSDDAVGKKSAVGASVAKLVPFGQSLGLQGDRSAFESRVDTLKSNLTLDNLKLLKGAMSDKDLLFLNSIGSSLNTNMSEKEFNGELDRVIEKLKGAGAGTIEDVQVVNGVQYKKAADGLYYPI